MMPINLLPQRERLWQRQRRWWHQRWAWTLGMSLAVWAAAAGALAWQQHQWKNLNAQVQADMDAQAPQRQAHQRWTQEPRRSHPHFAWSVWFGTRRVWWWLATHCKPLTRPKC